MASRETGQHGSGRAIPFRETDLKICDLCGWLNLASNTECFICGWHGRFERHPDAVHAAVELALRRYGRLELQHFTDPRTYRQPLAMTWPRRFWLWLKRLAARLSG